MKTILVLTLVLLWFSPALAQNETEPDEALGEKISLQETTGIEIILSSPDQWVGQEVLVEGVIKDVCPKAGCWIDLNQGANAIRVKVKDGEIVFPMSAIGKEASVQGMVEAIELSEEEAIAYHKHVAEEKGEAFDPATVTGPEKLYRIKGVGAVIKQKAE